MPENLASLSKLGLAGPDFKVLPVSYYLKDTVEVAQDLLGKLLVVAMPRGLFRWGRIVETEAYCGEDPASHASRGKTERCAPMFERGGIAYVYFIYGMYDMFNVVTEPEGRPGAVLIRGLEPLSGFGPGMTVKEGNG